MPELLHCLSGHDLGFLRIVAETWGVSCSGKDTSSFARGLASALLDVTDLKEVVISLPQQAQTALTELKQQGGSVAWSVFTREYGNLRSMGPAKRKREKPQLFPVSTTERLWYRALIGRDFIWQNDELLEVAYIPNEFLDQLPEVLPGRLALPEANYSPVEPNLIYQSVFFADRVLDDSCTLLASLRRDIRFILPSEPPILYWESMQQLLQNLSLIDQAGPMASARPFLEMPRGQALTWLVNAWVSSRRFNELRLVPEFTCEGTWQNNALSSRRFVLGQVAQLPAEKWVFIPELVENIQCSNPDFLRKGGDYDAWIISQNTPERSLLRGVESWDEVEVNYIHYLVTGPMAWLGLVELASSGKEGVPANLVRKSEWFDTLLGTNGALNLPAEDSPVAISSSGLLSMTNLTPRIARYQLSRFCEWLEISPKRYQYQLTPSSLKAASNQGLTTKHLISLLRKYGRRSTLSPALVKAIQRWQSQGREAWMEQVCVLRLASPGILQALRDSPARNYLGESLGPVSVIVQPGGIEKVQAALARLGYLADMENENG